MRHTLRILSLFSQQQQWQQKYGPARQSVSKVYNSAWNIIRSNWWKNNLVNNVSIIHMMCSCRRRPDTPSYILNTVYRCLARKYKICSLSLVLLYLFSVSEWSNRSLTVFRIPDNKYLDTFVHQKAKKRTFRRDLFDGHLSFTWERLMCVACANVNPNQICLTNTTSIRDAHTDARSGT